MIPGVKNGSSVGGLINYHMSNNKGYLLDTNMLGETPKEWEKEFKMVTDLNKNYKNPVSHFWLSAAKGETISDEAFTKIGKGLLKELVYEDRQYIIFRHTDTDKEHIHLVVNKLNLKSKSIKESWQLKRMIRFCRFIEKKYDLVQVQEKENSHRITKSEIELEKRTGFKSNKSQIKQIIDDALISKSRKINTSEFIEYLNNKGIDIKFYAPKNYNRISGVAFKHKGYLIKSSSLGKAYSWSRISTKIDFSLDRDLKVIVKANDKTIEVSKQEKVQFQKNVVQEKSKFIKNINDYLSQGKPELVNTFNNRINNRWML